jgi:hypothetical protein
MGEGWNMGKHRAFSESRIFPDPEGLVGSLIREKDPPAFRKKEVAPYLLNHPVGMVRQQAGRGLHMTPLLLGTVGTPPGQVRGSHAAGQYAQCIRQEYRAIQAGARG